MEEKNILSVDDHNAVLVLQMNSIKFDEIQFLFCKLNNF